MKKDFDFEQVGKRLPYKAPDSYVENFKPNFLRHTPHRNNKMAIRLFVYAAASVALLIISSLIVLNPGKRQNFLTSQQETEPFANINSADFNDIIKSFTDEELTTLSVILDSDMFEN